MKPLRPLLNALVQTEKVILLIVVSIIQMLKFTKKYIEVSLISCVFLFNGCITRKVIVPKTIVKYVTTPVFLDHEIPNSIVEKKKLKDPVLKGPALKEPVLKDSALKDPALKDSFYVELDNILEDEELKHSQIGVYLYDLTANVVLFKYNEQKLMRPASCEKLLTTITALKKMGVNCRYNTEILYDGLISKGTLKGNLYIRGGFDPLLDKNDLEKLASSIQHKGIHRITGMIYTDQSLKDTLKWGEGWCWDDDNPMLRPLILQGKDNFMPYFLRELTRAGVHHKNAYCERRASLQCLRLCSLSHPLTDALNYMLKESDNLYAESIFSQLLRTTSISYPNKDLAADCVLDFISELGFNPDNYRIADGCGLSLYNYVSPELLATALIYAFKNNEIFHELYKNLPIGGVDGTLKDRMKNSKAYNNVHAKTGSLSGVSTLAGYCKMINNHYVAFAIMNQGVRHTDDGRMLQDRICKVLTEMLPE